jgi:outer membrane protein assembly factor BamB
VAYTKLPEPQPGGVCQERIYGPTVDARLLAVDAKTGQPCADFGVNGQVDLKKGMGEIIPGYYYVSSMPQVVRGKVVMGGWVSDGQMTGEPSGVIRAFDATTGAFAWAFDMGKPDFHGEPAAGEHYTRSTPIPGARSVRTTSSAWSTSPPATPRPTTTRATAPSWTTSSAARCWASMPTTASWCGTSRPRTTTCGTTTWRPSPACWI